MTDSRRRRPASAVPPRARSGDPLALAELLVSTPSVNPALEPGGQGEAEIASVTAGLLEDWGFAVAVGEVAPGRSNVLARAGRPEGPTVLLNGHLDTVGVDGMTVDPFGAVLEGGRLYGRGSCDMKGGVAAILAAAASLAPAADSMEGELVVALTADEEHASLGMAALVEAGIRADAAIVCEPTSLAVMPAHKGFVWLEVVFRGRAAHGSRPEVGIDAVRHAALFLAALEEHAAELASGPRHPLLGPGSFHVGTIRGGTAPSVYPAECRLTLERRTLPGEAADRVEGDFRAALERLRESVPELDADVVPGLARPGTEVSATSPLVRTLMAAIVREGPEPRVEGMTAWVDAAYLNEAGIPAVCFGPGSIAQAHSADEWCDVGEIRTCAAILERWVRSVLVEERGGLLAP